MYFDVYVCIHVHGWHARGLRENYFTCIVSMVNILQMQGERVCRCVSGKVLLMCLNVLHQTGDPNLVGGQTISGLGGSGGVL